MASANRRLVILLTDEAGIYVALAELSVAHFRECNDQRMSP